MTDEHTPGPWNTDHPCTRWVCGCDGLPVAACDIIERDPDECDANVRLIAAAPDLLAALRSVVELCDDADAEELGQEAASIAAGAIAKAEGA